MSDNNIDLIVMGTKGETDSDRVVFGSNTTQIINKRCCPVIAVPDDYKFVGLKNILFPSDLNLSFKHKHFQPILKISELHKSNIKVLHLTMQELTSLQRIHKEFIKETFADYKTTYNILKEKGIADVVYLIHGEPTALDAFRSKIENTYSWHVKIPQLTDVEKLII